MVSLYLVLTFIQKNNNLQPHVSQRGFRAVDKFNLYVFDIRYQKHFPKWQNGKSEFKRSTTAGECVAAGTKR